MSVSNDTSGIAPATIFGLSYNAFAVGASGFPAITGTYLDTAFGAVNPTGSTVRRLTAESGTPEGQDIYGHHWANADGTYFFFNDPSSGTCVMSVAGGTVVRANVTMSDNTADTSWHPTNPDKYFYFAGATLREYTVSTGGNTIIHTFPSTLLSLGGTVDFVDATGNFFIVAYGGTYAGHVYRRDTDTIYTGATFPDPASGGGYAHMMAGGTKVIWVLNGVYNFYSLNNTTNVVSAVLPFWDESSGDHAGFVSASDGNDYMVRLENTFNGSIYRVKIQDATGRTSAQRRSDNTVLLPTTWNFSFHVSGVGLGTFRDWVFMDTEYPTDTFNHTTAGWPGSTDQQEIIAFNVVTLEHRRFCHHRSRDVDAYYDAQPRVSVAWDGSLVLWASNFNKNTTNYCDFWGIQNPFGSAAPTTVPPLMMGHRYQGMA